MVPFAVCGGVVAVAVPFVVSADKTDFMAAGMEFVVVCEAVCRDGVPMDSKVVGQLKAREKVEVMRHEQVGAGKTMKNRVMLKSLTEGGLQGWVSELSGSGVRLLTTAVAVDPAKQPSATIKMYSMPVRCQWCERAKQLLAAKGWAGDIVNEVDIMTDEKLLLEMGEVTKRDTGAIKNTVPQIYLVWRGTDGVVSEEYIGGYDALSELDRSGGLDEKLNMAVSGATPPPKKKGWFS